ncbi:MAG: fibronectin type III domain-containing protein [Nitrospira sp.]
MIKTAVIGLLFTSVLFLSGCGGDGGSSDGAPSVSSSPGSTGAIATLAWDPVQDPSIFGYYVHYGRISSGQPGTCAYEDAQFVSSPHVTITNLEHNTQYYFAVSAYNGMESACSNEVSTLTPPSQA